MEVYLYNSTVCRLCGEENDNGTLLYSCEENSQSLSDIINLFLPIKVSDDGLLPRTICPGCTIQLEATVEFLNLIINGQKTIRELHQREKEYKKSLSNINIDQKTITENIVYEVNTTNGVYQVEHPISLQVAGLEKPKRKRGRPPKKSKSPEELALEASAREQQQALKKDSNEEPTGKRRRKTPTRFKEVVQGKELERIFKEEGVIDPEESDNEMKSEIEPDAKLAVSKEPEVIGHMENSGELVVMVKGKGRGRPKGRMRTTQSVCAICGMQFMCAGRYMSHVAAHGRVHYQCSQCGASFPERLSFTDHQERLNHTGQRVLQTHESNGETVPSGEVPEQEAELLPVEQLVDNAMTTSLPDLNPQPLDDDTAPGDNVTQFVEVFSSAAKIDNGQVPEETSQEAENAPEAITTSKVKLKCNHCDKVFSNKQSKSMHIKAVHKGDRPYVCGECGAKFSYPRSLTLHAASHRRHLARGYGCDLCGKVLNHPSSVVYHKEAEHAGQRFVCHKCDKSFKHRQLLQRHQLVHSQLRPFSCKMCDASFKTKANLLNHQLLHSGVKKFSCEICKHKFAHKTSLTLHMRWHTGQKPYSCGVCGKSFSQKGNLSEHERIHSGEKPYECNLCNRRFTTSSQHRLHAHRHNGRPPKPPNTNNAKTYRCPAPACGRSFAERPALKRHLRRHTGERPFRCPHCPRAFADSSNLNKHKKQVHKQMSLLASSPGALPASLQQAEVALETAEGSERVIFVRYQDLPPECVETLHVLDEHEMEEVVEDNVVSECSVVEELDDAIMYSPDQQDHMPVTDEQGNPLHFTMQDGTRLAIMSTDGKTLQVVTQDGQTIPVEINGYADEQEVDNPDTIVHQLNLQKTVEPSSPVTYFTIV